MYASNSVCFPTLGASHPKLSPSQYGSFKISYNIHKEKWLVNELLAMCVQEEKRLNQEVGDSAHLVT